MKAKSSVLALVFGCASVASAHPHFNKTVTVTLGAVEVAITYNTTPSNETHAQTAAVGAFVTPRRPILKLSGELNTGSVTLPAGEYTIGVIKVSEKDWVLALYPGASVAATRRTSPRRSSSTRSSRPRPAPPTTC